MLMCCFVRRESHGCLNVLYLTECFCVFKHDYVEYTEIFSKVLPAYGLNPFASNFTVKDHPHKLCADFVHGKKHV